MDTPKNGESSRGPTDAVSSSASAAAPVAPAALILPQWDVTPPKVLHASLDLISLLHLDGLYNTYVRPYFDPVPETDDEADAGGGGGARPRKPQKKQGMSKGYVGLLEDCIDPIPLGNQAGSSLVSLIPDLLDHEKPPPSWEFANGPLVELSAAALAGARLEKGIRVEGYAAGEKTGVREAEERRRKKKAARLSQSVAPDLPDIPHLPGSPALGPSGGAPGPGTPHPPPPRGPRTPFVPRGGRPGGAGTPGRPAFPRASAPPSANYTPRARTPGTAGTPGGMPRPSFSLAASRAGAGPGTPGVKRPAPGDGPSSVKRVKGTVSRSASPAVGHEVGVKAVFKRRTEEP